MSIWSKLTGKDKRVAEAAEGEERALRVRYGYLQMARSLGTQEHQHDILKEIEVEERLWMANHPEIVKAFTEKGMA